MIRQLRDNELKVVAEIIRDLIFVPTYSGKNTVFLCGADLADRKTGRHKMAELFKTHTKYELLYPEDIFDDLLAGQGQYSLLDLEDLLADSVDSIVLFPESPGSFAELGAFANNKKLVNKLIYVGQKKYAKKKSFINYGPVRLIKASKTGKIFNIAYDALDSDKEKNNIYTRINKAIIAMKKINPRKPGVINILEMENFILPCIYLIDSIKSQDLYKLVELATGQDRKISEIVTKSAISRLIKTQKINRTIGGFSVTKKGIYRFKSSKSTTTIDVVRIAIINAQCRKRVTVEAGIFECAHL